MKWDSNPRSNMHDILSVTALYNLIFTKVIQILNYSNFHLLKYKVNYLLIILLLLLFLLSFLSKNIQHLFPFNQLFIQ